MMRVKLIDHTWSEGVYGLMRDELLVDCEPYGRLYLAEGYGGEQTAEGGCYRWIQGLAWQVEAEHIEDIDVSCQHPIELTGRVIRTIARRALGRRDAE